MKNASKLPEKSWILYDVANSAFVLIIVTTIMPIFFKDVVSAGVDPSISTGDWGFANALASMILAISAPILGTFADYSGHKKRFFSIFLFLGITSVLVLTRVEKGDRIFCLLVFVIARVGWSGANLFYDSFIVDVTDENRMDRVSSHGYAWGYIGSVVPFLMVIGIIMFQKSSGDKTAISVFSAAAAFFITAIWWGLFSIPMLKNVRQIHGIERSNHPVADSFRRLSRTFREIRKYRRAFLFLAAYFFYIDGVNTVITMAAAYGRDIGLGVNNLILAVLMIQIVAFPFAVLYGRLAERYSAKKMIHAGIGVYTVITVIAFFIPALPGMKFKIAAFWVLAFLVATSQGGIQALSRSFFGKLIPADRSAEFFGFYNICGKFAAITGPLIMGTVSRVTGNSRFGILSIIFLFVAGTIILLRVERE